MRKILIARENDQNSERMTENGNSLTVYKSSPLRICIAMYIEILIA